ncbi:MAG TPA: S8 family serine peptidase [Rubricoccaceae bacterium]|nr:S8 family serine peptidase [Rubricoccaceae bacterium]
MTRFLLLLTLATGAAGALHAQPTATAKYWVFFIDKGDGAARAPSFVVSERAAARRALRGQAARPRGVDVPVSPAYVAALEALGAEVAVESRWLNAVSAVLTPAQIDAVAALPFVRELRPVARLERTTLPSFTPLAPPSPLAPVAGGYDYGPSEAQLALVHADAALEAGYDGDGVVLGYLDTLFDFSHQALVHIPDDGRLLGVEDFTGQEQDNYHGLNTTSVALGFDPGDLIGPAFMAEVLAATTEYAPTETHDEEDFFIAGLEWLEANGVDVVNVSLGYSTFDPGEGDYTYEDLDGDTTPFTQAVDRAAALGVAVVVAAGNEGDGSWRYITAPADADSAIAVAAVRLNGTRASFSGVGPTADGRLKPDVAALGVDVHVASRFGGYTDGNGTSFAAPMVAGVVCQLLEADPTLDPIAIRDLLRATASQASDPDSLLGWGIADAEAAVLLAVAAEPGVAEARPWRLFPSVARAGGRLVAEVDVARPGPLTLALYDVLGRRVGTLYDGPVAAGPTRLPLAAPALAPGLYFVRADGPDLHAAARLVVVR